MKTWSQKEIGESRHDVGRQNMNAKVKRIKHQGSETKAMKLGLGNV